MTMLSFRVLPEVAAELQRWAARLGVDRSELLRDALRRNIVRLASEDDLAAWDRQPLGDDEHALAAIAEWGPAEDWSEWCDEPR